MVFKVFLKGEVIMNDIHIVEDFLKEVPTFFNNSRWK